MRKVPLVALVVAVLVSLVAGGMVGFVLGVASTRAGAQFIEEITEQEQQAVTASPLRLERERFSLLYPSNWVIDNSSADYDPDYRFSIESPGATYMMFLLGVLATDPEENVRTQVAAFTKVMGTPAIERFERLGHNPGSGAVLKGKIMGTPVTVKMFSCFLENMTAIIVQQYPDEDARYVEEGLALIEKSFRLKPEKATADAGLADGGQQR